MGMNKYLKHTHGNGCVLSYTQNTDLYTGELILELWITCGCVDNLWTNKENN